MRLDNDAGDFIFNNPSDSLTVKLTMRDVDLTVESFDNPYSGDLSLLGTSNYNDIDIKSDLLLLGGDLSIEGWDIILEAGKILSTRDIDVSAGIPDYQNATSIGPSGDVDIQAVSFTMKDGSKILAQGSASYSGGSVKIEAADTMGYAIDAIDWIREHLDLLIGTQQGVYLNYAEVILNNASILGDSVSINVDSGYVMDYYILKEVLEGTEVGSIVEALTSIAAIQKGLLPIPIGVNVRISSSNIELNGTSSITAAKDVTLIASSEVKANLTTAFGKFAIAIAVGYGYANVSINDTAKITSTAGNILIRSIDDNDAEVGAEVGSTKSTDVIKGKLLAIALGASVVNSKITLASGAALSAYGSVNLLAEGKNFGGSRGTAYITGGGDGSITIGLFIGVSNVSTDVKGTITAQAQTNVASDLPIDLDKISNSIINIPNHGLKTGDVVTYHVGDYSTAIDGLTNGEQYYVIVLDADHIELVGKAPIDIDNGNVNDGSQQSLTPMEVKDFVPSSSLNADTDTFTISGHGFIAGEVIVYSALQNDLIGGLSDMTQYTVFNVVGNTFQLKDSDGNLVDITSVPSGSDNQAFVYPDSANAKIISVSDDNVINSNDDTIYIPNHGFETGDLILYTVDPTKTTNISVNYKYGVGLDAINTTDNTLCIQYAGDLAVGDEVVYNTTDHSSIEGLADGTTYVISALTACTEEDATCAYIQLTNKTTGQVVTFSTVTYDPVSQNGTAYAPVETLTKTETQVGMDAALAGLTNNTYYYVVKVDNDHIMLATSLDNAEQTGPIDLGVSATTHGSDHVLETGLTNGIGISAILRTSEKSFAGAAVGNTYTATDMLQNYLITSVIVGLPKKGVFKLWDLFKQYVLKKQVTPDEPKAAPTEGSIDLAGAISATITYNDVKALVESTAVLKSGKDISVIASQWDKWSSVVQADATTSTNDSGSQAGGETAAIGAGINLVVLLDNIKAEIADGAHVDAGRNLTVDASLEYPFLIKTFVTDLMNASAGSIFGTIFAGSKLPDWGICTDLFNSFVRSLAQGGADTKASVAGSIDFVYLGGNTTARIGDNVQVNQDVNYRQTTQNVTVSASTEASFVNVVGNFRFALQPGLADNKKIESVKKYFKGFPSTVFTPFGSGGGKNGAGGSVYLPIMIFNTTAEVGNNTNINLGTSGKLDVNASTSVINFSLVQAGSQASSGFGIAGAISVVSIVSSTIARIASTIHVVGGSVSVSATDNTININLVGSIAVGGNAGVGISVALNVIDRQVVALIGNYEDGTAGPWEVDFSGNGDQAPITMTLLPAFDGNGTITKVTVGSTDTQAVQLIQTNATQGAFTLTYEDQTTGSLAWNATASQIQSALNALSTINAAGGVTVTGGGDGDPWTVTFNTIGEKSAIASAAVSGGTPFSGQLTTDSTDGTSSTPEVQTIRNDATGNDLTFSYNGSSTAALAYDVDAAALQTALRAIGADVTVTQVSSDSWTITFNSNGDKSAITATYEAEVDSSLYIDGAVNTYEVQHLSLSDATQGAYTLEFEEEFTAPLAWNATASQIQSALNALSAVQNLNTAGTAYVTVAANGDGFDITFSEYGEWDYIQFVAYDAFDGNASTDTLQNGTSSSKESQALIHSSHSGAFTLSFGGETSALLPYNASAAQVAAALNAMSSIAAAGGVTVKALSGDSANPSLNLTGDVSLNAKADGQIWGLSLAGAGTKESTPSKPSTSGSSGGSGMPRKHWQATLLVQMGLAGKNLPGSTTSTVQNSTQQTKNSLALGGDISINVSVDNVKAEILDAGLIRAKTVTAKANNDTAFRLLAGSAAINTNGTEKSVGIAGSVVFNWMDGTTRAKVENVILALSGTTADSATGLDVEAERGSDIISIAAGGAGAPREKGIAVAGSVAINIIHNVTEALIEGIGAGSTLNSGITNSAADDSQIIGIAGALSYGGKAGIGASLAVNLILNEVRAKMYSVLVSYAGEMKNLADSSATIISAAGALGASKGKVGFGGTLAFNLILGSIESLLDSVNTSFSSHTGAVTIAATNDDAIYNVAGAVGGGETAGVGAAISLNFIAPTIRAAVTNSNLLAGDRSALDTDESPLTVKAVNSAIIDSATAGGAGSQKVAVAAAVAANVVLNTTTAYVKDSTLLATGDILVKADDTAQVNAGSGNVAGAGKVAVGASVAFNWIGATIQAYISGGSVTSTNGNVQVLSTSAGQMIALAVGGQGAGNVAVGGSVVIGTLVNTVKAYLENSATVTAFGNVGVNAEDNLTLVFVAGVAGGAGTVAVGISNTTLVTDNHIEAYIGSGVKVYGKGKKATSQVYTGSTSQPGAWQQVAMRGVSVTAVSAHAVRSFAVGGVGAGDVAVAGSGSLTTVVDSIKAHIDSGATVIEGDADAEADSHSTQPLQNVNVFAAGKTIMWGVAGALAGAGTVGVGVGLDIGVLTKTVEAYVAGTVQAVGNILVQAISYEQVILISASLGAAGTVGVAGSAGIYTLVLNTKAHVDDGAVLYAIGSVLVNANDDTNVVLSAGGVSGAGTVGVGGSLDVSVEVKNVSAYIADGATVDAEGNGEGVVSFSGTYSETYTDNPSTTFTTANVNSGNDAITIADHGLTTGQMVTFSDGTSGTDATAGWLTNGHTYYAIVVDDNTLKLADTYADALAGTAVDLSSAAGDSSKTYSLTKANVVDVERPTFDPSTAVDNTNSSINLGYHHGYTTGQALVYSANGGTVIDGLIEGRTYYVIVVDDTTIKLALDQLDARNGVAVTLDNASATGSQHTLWNGTIDNVTPNVNVPGEQFQSDLNGDGTDDINSDQDALTHTRSTTPNTVTIYGVAVTALNRDMALTFVISAGGAGTVAVNLSGLTNVYTADVDATIGAAEINQHLLNPVSSDQSVYVIAGSDYFRIGVAAVGNGAGVVSVTPEADVLVEVSNVNAHISGGAKVYAADNVVVDAYSKNLIVSVSVGVTGSGMVSVSGSISVVSLVNSTKAYIGENDLSSAGAIVKALGNVFVDANDKTQVILVSGSLGLGFGAVGVGASLGVLVVVKDVSAFIGPNSQVDAKANRAGLVDMVYKNRMGSDGSFSTYDSAHPVRGVIVQAYSYDNVISVVGAGAGGLYTGVAGAILVNVFESDTSAFIGANAQINQDRSSVGAEQSVIVNSLNHAWIFNFAGSVGGGIVGVAGGIQVNVMRNDAKAYIGDYAHVTASKDVLVSALSNKDLIAVTVSLSGGGAGIGLTMLVNVVGSQFLTHYSVTYSESDRDENGDARDDGDYSETVDEDPVSENTGKNSTDYLTGQVGGASGSTGTFGGILGAYDSSDANGSDDDTPDNRQLSGQAAHDAGATLNGENAGSRANDALTAGEDDSRSGTVAYVGTGAVITALSGDIDIYAAERIHFVGAAGAVSAGGAAYGAAISVNVVGSNIEAYVLGGATLFAGDDIQVQAYESTDMSGWAIVGNFSAAQSVGGQVVVFTDHSNQRASIGVLSTSLSDVVTISHANDVLVMASADRKVLADASGVNVAIVGSAGGLAIAVSSVTGESLAYMGLVKAGETSGYSVKNVTVKALNNISSSKVMGMSVNFGSDLAIGGAISVNSTQPKSTAFIAKGADIRVTGAIKVIAIARADALALDINGNGGLFAGGLNVAVTVMSPTIQAYVDSDTSHKTKLYASSITIKTLYNVDDSGNTQDQGASAQSYGGQRWVGLDPGRHRGFSQHGYCQYLHQ